MDQQNQELEDLHRQASTLYLQGEYGAALQTWRQLLKIAPKDERAREGARLCELLVQEDGPPGSGPGQPAQNAESVPGLGSPPASAAPPTPAVGFGVGEDLDQSLDELDELLGDNSGSDWMEASPNTMEAGASARQIEFGASDAALPEVTPPAVTEAPAPAPPAVTAGDPIDDGFEFNFDGTDQQAVADAPGDEAAAFDFTGVETQSQQQAPGPAPDGAAQTASSAASAEELQRRTNELMAEAMEHYERGEREEALAALSRLAILDEADEAAGAFADHIRAEIEESKAPAEPAPAEPATAEFDAAQELPPETAVAPEPDLNHEPFEFVEQENGDSSLALGSPGVSAPVDEAMEAPPVELPEGFGDDEAIEDSAALPTTVAGKTPKAAGKISANRWLMIAAAALLVLGGGFAVFQFVGGRASATDTPLAAPPPLSDSVPPAAEPPVASNPSAGNAAPQGPSTVPGAVPTAEIDALLRRGEDEIESGDYAAAVLTYNEALELDPEDPAIQTLLLEAGELYQGQKETLQQRRMAIQAFNEGDFRNALRLFYRLEPMNEEESARFDRYKRNGWFNMGLRALKSGDCRMARSHLREARQIDPGDPGVLDALELSAACFESRSQAFFDAVRPLNTRGLDD